MYVERHKYDPNLGIWQTLFNYNNARRGYKIQNAKYVTYVLHIKKIIFLIESRAYKPMLTRIHVFL